MNIVALKRLCEVVDERAGDRRPPLLSVSIHLGVVPRSAMTEDAHRAEDLSGYKFVRPGDIVVNRMRAFQGAAGRSDVVGLVSPDYLVLRLSRSLNSRYFHHLFRSSWFVGEMTSRLRGIGSVDQGNVRTPRVNAEELGEIRLDLPHLRDQQAIADFLDTETARIDALITKKRRVVELLGKRVGRRIDDELNALYGPTTARPTLSAVVRIAEGQVDPRVEPYAHMALVAPNHVEAGTGRLLETATAAEQGAISGKYICEPGWVIYSKIRPSLRKACVAPQRCLTSADMYPLQPMSGLTPQYLLYFLLSERFSDFAVMESERVAMPKINRDAFGRIRIPLPPATAQDTVVQRLDEVRATTAAVVDRLRKQIALLQEHRQALITAAVTGELDIPGVAA